MRRNKTIHLEAFTTQKNEHKKIRVEIKHETDEKHQSFFM